MITIEIFSFSIFFTLFIERSKENSYNETDLQQPGPGLQQPGPGLEQPGPGLQDPIWSEVLEEGQRNNSKRAASDLYNMIKVQGYPQRLRLKRRLYGIYVSCNYFFFLQFTFLFLFSPQLKTFFFHWQIKKKQFKDQFKKEDLVYILDRKIWKVSSRLYSLNFCGQPSMWNNLKSWAFIYCLCYMSHKLNCPVLPMKKKN